MGVAQFLLVNGEKVRDCPCTINRLQEYNGVLWRGKNTYSIALFGPARQCLLEGNLYYT